MNPSILNSDDPGGRIGVTSTGCEACSVGLASDANGQGAQDVEYHQS